MGSAYSAVPQTELPLIVRTHLPAWMYSKAAYEAEANNPGTAFHPAVPSMRFLGWLSLATQTSILILAKKTAFCTQSGFAGYNFAIFSVMCPVFIVRCYVEMNGLRLAASLYMKRIERIGSASDEDGRMEGRKVEDPFKLFGFKVGFVVWLVFYASCSTLNLIDLGTDSAFTATALHALECNGKKMRAVWAATWAKSVFSALPVVDLSMIILALWLFSIAQMIYPLLRTIPQDCKCHAIGVVDLDKGWPHFWNICGVRVDSGDAFSALSDASGCASLQALAIADFKAEAWLDEGSFNAYRVCTVGNSAASKMVLSYICENCLQISIQTTLYAMSKSLTEVPNVQAERQAVFSIGLSVFMTVLKFKESREVLWVDVDYQKTFSLDSIQHLESSFKNSRRVVKVGSVIMIVALAYSTIKLIAAHVCNDALWNITGCVDLSDVLKEN